MSKYIDADTMIKAMPPIMEWLSKKASTIDIVRCGECKHCADDYIDVGMGTMPQFTCELGRCGESVQPNDFCSYGERSEKPNNSKERSE